MPRRYGSIPTTEENSGGGGRGIMDPESCYYYEEYDMTYLMAPTLTISQRVERWCRGAVPILVAAIFLWIAGAFFSSGSVRCGGYPTDPKFCFDTTTVATTVPPRSTTTATTSTTVTTTTTTSPSQIRDHSKIWKNEKDCDYHPACHNLGLTGTCCPTEPDGILLGCCTEEDAWWSNGSQKPSTIVTIHSKERENNTGTVSESLDNKENNQTEDKQYITDLKLCSQNPGCQRLGLTGNCCPTNVGVILGCCTMGGK